MTALYDPELIVVCKSSERERAKAFVRDVLVSVFKQDTDEITISAVADKVLKALPKKMDS